MYIRAICSLTGSAGTSTSVVSKNGQKFHSESTGDNKCIHSYVRTYIHAYIHTDTYIANMSNASIQGCLLS